MCSRTVHPNLTTCNRPRSGKTQVGAEAPAAVRQAQAAPAAVRVRVTLAVVAMLGDQLSRVAAIDRADPTTRLAVLSLIR